MPSNMPGICYQFKESGKCSYGSRCKFSHNSMESTANGANRRSSTGSLSTDHLEAFFAQHGAFDYSPDAPSSQEFYRMCDFFEWDRDDPERVEAHEDFKTALVQQFNNIYGTDVEDIQSWIGLCLALDISPPPNDPHEAKKLLKGKFVNLVDLVDAKNSGREVTQFESLEELQKYTIARGRYFPRDSAHAGGVLKFLLREILTKYEGRKLGQRRRR